MGWDVFFCIFNYTKRRFDVMAHIELYIYGISHHPFCHALIISIS